MLLHSDLLSSNTLFGEVRGTPGYMAPEQIEKDRNPDTRTDVYQLGCILYSILTLQHPVEGEANEAIEKKLRGEITPPRQRNKRFCLTVACSTLVMIYGAAWAYWTLAAMERIATAARLDAEQTPAQLLLAALQAEPDNLLYLRSMGEHYFIVQRFDQAAEYLDRGE